MRSLYTAMVLLAVGCAGRDGATGATGSDGLTSLVHLADEPTGAHCPNGGTRIDSGVDANRNGELDAAEVSQTQYACSGATPSRALILSSVEGPGPACALGGSRVDVGTDSDGDGVLDASEITSTTHVCNGATGATGDAGAPGAASLVSIVLEPAGSNCPDGGRRVSSGLDANANGQLDSAEVSSTAYVCDGGVGGTVLVAQQVELPGNNCSSGGVAIKSGLDSNENGVLDSSEVTATSYVCNGPQYFSTGWSASPVGRLEIGGIGNVWTKIFRDTSIFKVQDDTVLKITVSDNASFAYGAVSGGVGYYAVLVDGAWAGGCYTGSSDNVGSGGVTTYVHQPLSLVCIARTPAGLHRLEAVAASVQGAAYIGWQATDAQLLVEEISSNRLAYVQPTSDVSIDSTTWVQAADRDVAYTKQSTSSLLKVTISDTLRAGYPTYGEAHVLVRMDGADTTCRVTTYDNSGGVTADFHAPFVATCVLPGVAAGPHVFSVWLSSSVAAANSGSLGYLASSLVLVEEIDAAGVSYINGPSYSGDVSSTVDTQIAGRSLSINVTTPGIYKLTYSDTFRPAGTCNAASGFYTIYGNGVASVATNGAHFNLAGLGSATQDHYRAINETSLWSLSAGTHTFTVWGRADCGANSFGYDRGQVLMLLEPLR